MRGKRYALVLLTSAAVLTAAVWGGTQAIRTTIAGAATPTSGLHVSGNRLVDAGGNPVVLWGVNRSGAEYSCVPHGSPTSTPTGVFDGPVDDTATAAIASWTGVNSVRVPLNEDCWMGHSNVPAALAGANYQSAIAGYVSTLHRHGLVAILDLHWTDGLYNNMLGACTSDATPIDADCQKPMPDAATAVPFWTSVASTFKNDPATVFDLFNEPFPDFSLGSGAPSWTCWRDGGSACGTLLFDSAHNNIPAAGMQSLVNAVRGAGATNVIILGGLAFSNDESMWLQFKPSDPTGNLAASWHSYNFNTCSNSSCWQQHIAPLAASVPVVAGEIGENDCAHGYIDGLMSFLDSVHTSYLGWAWNADFPCSSGPGLITAYDGTPTSFGIGLKSHLAQLVGPTPTPTSPTPSPSNRPSPTPTPTPTSGGGFTATPVVSSSSPWFNEEQVRLTTTGTLSSLTVTIVVQETTGISFSGQYNTVGGQIQQSHSSTSSALTCTFTLAAGQTLPAGTNGTFAAQTSGSGTAHPTSGDTFTVTATSGGTTTTQSGHF